LARFRHNPHILLSAVVSCPTTPPAANKRAAALNTVEIVPVLGLLLAYWIMPWITWGALGTDHPSNGFNDLVLCRFSAKDKAGDSYRNNQQGRQREKRVMDKAAAD
jgi:hypothetical protein